MLLYIGSLVALFLNSAYQLKEDGSGIDKVLGTSNYRELVTTAVYRNVAIRTVLIAVAVTVIDVVLAVPLAGKYRLVDIPISNCLNSDINRMFLLTQFQTASLHRHIQNT